MKRIVSFVVAAAVTAATGAAHAQLSPSGVQTADRSVEAVVVTGAKLPRGRGPAATVECMPYPSGTTGGRDAHNGIPSCRPTPTGVPVDEIAAYRWNGTQFIEIPVQVDQMYPYCLSNPASSFAVYSGTDRGADLRVGRRVMEEDRRALQRRVSGRRRTDA